jgi:acetyl esterase
VSYRYDPELVAVAAAYPDLDLTDVPAARRVLRDMREQLPPFLPPASLAIEKRLVPGPPGDHEIEVCVLSPRGLSAPAPALYWIHGGGFMLGDVDGDLEQTAELAAALSAVVVSVEYRLAPEHPFPAPAEDCFAGLRWLFSHAGDLGIDRSRVAIAGVSAGAGLAAAVTLMARDRGGPAVCLQVLDIPDLDDRLGTASMAEFTGTPVWNRPKAVLSWQAYLGPGHRGETSPYAAPARAADLRGLPPAYIVTCEFDPLRDEGIEYGLRLMAAGVPVELHHYPGTFHGSGAAGRGTAISDRMTGDRTAALARAFARPAS